MVSQTKIKSLSFVIMTFVFFAVFALCGRVGMNAASLDVNISGGNASVTIWRGTPETVGTLTEGLTGTGTAYFEEDTLYVDVVPASGSAIGSVTYENDVGATVYIGSGTDITGGKRYTLPSTLTNLGELNISLVGIYSLSADPAVTHGSITVTGGTDVASGTDVSYTVTAASGYRISDIRINGSSVDSFTDETTYTDTYTLTSSSFITADFVKERYDVTFSIPQNADHGKFFVLASDNTVLETLDATNPSAVLHPEYGAEYKLKAELVDPAGLYVFDDFTLSSGAAGTLTAGSDAYTYSYTVGDIGSEGADAEVDANFSKEFVNIAFNVGQHGSITYTGTAGTVTVNSDVHTSYRSSATNFTFTATPASSLYIIGTVTFTPTGGTPTTITPSGGVYSVPKTLDDGTLNVTFTDAATYSVTVKAPSEANCYLTVKADGIKLAAGAHRIAANSTVTVSASTDEGSGYEFDYITLNGVLHTSSSSCTFSTLTQDIEIGAVFEKFDTYKITISAGKGGTVTQSGGLSTSDTSVQVNKGDKVTFTVTPDSGYKLESISYNGSDLSKSGRTYTTGRVTKDSTLTVDFISRTDGVLSADIDNEGKTVVSVKSTDDVIELVDNYSGSIFKAPMSESGVVDSDLLYALKGENVALRLVGDKYYWILYGNKINSTSKNTNLTVTTGDDIINEKFLTPVARFEDKTQFRIAHDGKLPFTAGLYIDVGEENVGRYANLFYFDDVNYRLVGKGCTIVDKYGYAGYSFQHASDYIIVIADKQLTSADLAAYDSVVFTETENFSFTDLSSLKTAGLLLGGVLLVGGIIAFVLSRAGRSKE